MTRRSVLRDHVIRYLPRDYPLFARLNPGDQYPQAWQHALDMLDERIAELKRQGTVIRPGTAAYDAAQELDRAAL